MNIFVLDSSPLLAAQQQCDKHVVKMIVESAQMLSTAHRLLDGKVRVVERFNADTGKTRKAKIWLLDDKRLDADLYAAVHTGHPCTIWTMESLANYLWHYQHFVALCDEYTHRYGKKHATDTKLRLVLDQAPDRIPDIGPTQFKLAMKSNPECMNPADPVASYRAFYRTKQSRFKMVWSKRTAPDWFTAMEIKRYTKQQVINFSKKNVATDDYAFSERSGGYTVT